MDRGWLKCFKHWLHHYQISEHLNLDLVPGWQESGWVSLLDRLWDSPTFQGWYVTTGNPVLVRHTMFQRLRRELFRADRQRIAYLPSGYMDVWIAMLDGPIVPWDYPFLAALCIPYPDGTPRQPVVCNPPILCYLLDT